LDNEAGSVARKQETYLAEPPVVRFETDGFVMGTWKNVAIHVWTKRATLPLVDKLEALSASFVAMHPEGISSIHIIAKNAPLPSGEVRDRFLEVANRFAKQLACIGHVVEGSGFWASALQSFLTGLHWLSRRTFEFRICSSISAVAYWLPELHAQRTGVTFEGGELEQAVEQVRRRAG
jgi:hypothetical protein